MISEFPRVSQALPDLVTTAPPTFHSRVSVRWRGETVGAQAGGRRDDPHPDERTKDDDGRWRQVVLFQELAWLARRQSA